MSWQEVAPYVLINNQYAFGKWWLVNTDTWNSLNEDTQALFYEVAQVFPGAERPGGDRRHHHRGRDGGPRARENHERRGHAEFAGHAPDVRKVGIG